MSEKLSDFYLTANRGSGDVKTYKKFNKPSLTEQQHKDVVDINNIVKQYTMQGYRSEDFANLAVRVFADAKRFVDCTDLKDLQTASNMMIEAEASFIQNVPAKIRERFDNNPMKFYQACLNCNTKEDLRAMFGDVKNFAAPNVEQLDAGNHLPSSTSSKNDNSQDQ